MDSACTANVRHILRLENEYGGVGAVLCRLLRYESCIERPDLEGGERTELV